jgi:hypothetical protein
MQIQWDPGDTMEIIAKQANIEFKKPFFTEIVLIACWNIQRLKRFCLHSEVGRVLLSMISLYISIE